MPPVMIIGLGMSPADLTPDQLSHIQSADILVGGRRHLDYFPDHPGQKKTITRNLQEVAAFVQAQMADHRLVVLASGDPLFYGIAPVLIEALGAASVTVWPNITAVAAAFARIKTPWQEAAIVSLHGRANQGQLHEALTRKKLIAVFTDPKHDPGWLARHLLEIAATGFRMCVLEQMGTAEEKVRWFALSEAAGQTFQTPNMAVLKRTAPVAAVPEALWVGMPDECYEHERGLITKAEVRALALAHLRLQNDHVLWDLGAGSGAISIEAGLFVRRGRIVAVEQHATRVAQIERNRARFGVLNLEVVQAVLPAGLNSLPEPDRIFIGGGGRSLPAIIASATGALKPGGIMVINTVLVQNMSAALQQLQQLGLASQLLQIQISRAKAMPWGDRLEALNPVWIIAATKD